MTNFLLGNSSTDVMHLVRVLSPELSVKLSAVEKKTGIKIYETKNFNFLSGYISLGGQNTLLVYRNMSNRPGLFQVLHKPLTYVST